MGLTPDHPEAEKLFDDDRPAGERCQSKHDHDAFDNGVRLQEQAQKGQIVRCCTNGVIHDCISFHEGNGIDPGECLYSIEALFPRRRSSLAGKDVIEQDAPEARAGQARKVEEFNKRLATGYRAKLDGKSLGGNAVAIESKEIELHRSPALSLLIVDQKVRSAIFSGSLDPVQLDPKRSVRRRKALGQSGSAERDEKAKACPHDMGRDKRIIPCGHPHERLLVATSHCTPVAENLQIGRRPWARKAWGNTNELAERVHINQCLIEKSDMF
ncbi:hypothetical protein GGR34_001974 [Microvirga flocculans]|uniref:Uncharacterized protein n=1 Tax=Microvirga flocculans TaxID=217168 RepID=A0A7W6N873_9HYPH|nr:hypothetical protein [Microvirga flocculans]MBB4040321.1 hypothetical protein [Microvirga flocculans]